MELIGVDKKPDILSILVQFKDANAATRSFDVSLENKKKIWTDLFTVISSKSDCEVKFEGLNCARILSRDRNGLNEAITEEIIDQLLTHGDIGQQSSYGERVSLESLKVLSNLLQQSPVVQSLCTKNGFLSKLLSKISQYSDLSEAYESKMFDMRLLFLFTALCPEQRDIAWHNHHGVDSLVRVLATALVSGLQQTTVDVVCEALKVVFNLTVNSSQEDTAELVSVASVVKNIVRVRVVGDQDVRMKLVSNVINVVTNFDGRQEPLNALLKTTDLTNPAEEDKHHQDVVVNVLDSFLEYLEDK